MEQYTLLYNTSLSVNECIEMITSLPWEYKCNWGTPMWYECKRLSDMQIVVTFKGGKFRKAAHTQYLMTFSANSRTTVMMSFCSEIFGLPPLTSSGDIDYFMKEKIDAVRQAL